MADLKKIVFFITDCDFGGAEQVLFELCQGLQGKFQIQVLVLKSKGHFARLIEQLAIPVKSYELGPKPGLAYFFRMAFVFLRAWSDLRKIKPDIVQGILFQGNLFAKLASKLSGAKIILCSLHTFDQGRIKFLAENLTSFLAKKYIVVSNALETFCIEKLRIPDGKIIVVRNGIQIRQTISDPKKLREKLGIKSDARIIGTIARLHWEKGIDLLIRAFHHLASEFPETILVIIGDGPEKENLKELAENLGIRDRVIFTGFQPEPERFFALFDLFALGSRIEAMPVALMQAMAQGKAIVATKVGGVPELVEDNKEALLVPAEDEFMLTRAISRLLHDPKLAKRLGENARAKAEQEFSLKKMIESYQKIYLELIEDKN